MKCFWPIVSIIAVLLVLCIPARYINHPLIITNTNNSVDTTYFYIPVDYHFEVRTDDHFNWSWLVAVPDRKDDDFGLYRVIWLKRNVINYRCVDN